jgi:hypothetical protein
MAGRLQSQASRRLALTLALTAGLAVSAQYRPDFTGVWIQVDPPHSSESSHVVQIEQQGSVFKVKVQKSGPALTALYSLRDEHTSVIGAPPESRKDSDGRVRTVSVDWEREALVFVRTTIEGACRVICSALGPLTLRQSELRSTSSCCSDRLPPRDRGRRS